MLETRDCTVSYIITTENRDFEFNIPFFHATDIHCYLSGMGELVRGTDFIVEELDDYTSGATVTLLLADLPYGHTLEICRQTDMVQDLSLPEFGKLPAAGIERMFDKLIMICQELAKVDTRSLRAAPAEPMPDEMVGYAGDFAVTHLGGSEYRVEPGRIIVDGAVEATTGAETVSLVKGSIYLRYYPDTKNWSIGVTEGNGVPYQIAAVLGEGLFSQVHHGAVYYFTGSGSGGGKVKVDGTLSAAIKAENGTLKAVDSATGVLYMQNGVLTLRGTATCPVSTAAEDA